MNEEPIKIIVSNGALKFELNIEKWAINCNTKEYLIEKVTEYINEIIQED